MNLPEKNESIQHDVKDAVRGLKECVKKLEGELARTLANCCQTDSSTWRVSAGLMLSTPDVNAWKWLEHLKVFQQVTWKKNFLKFWGKLG